MDTDRWGGSEVVNDLITDYEVGDYAKAALKVLEPVLEEREHE